MRNILVFGGTRYFGKRLVEKLIANGDQVTIATRGESRDDFGNQVKRVIVDRTKQAELAEAFLSKKDWDIIYDNICYSPKEAQALIEIFTNKVTKVIFTSTMSTYPVMKAALTEQGFDPYTYTYQMIGREDANYDEVKRQAEAVYFQAAPFLVTAVRFPIVLGEDDYTKRLHFHIDRIKNRLPIGFPTLTADISFISSKEAADFLFWLGNTNVTGPINACSNEDISLKWLIQLIEQEIGQQAIISNEITEENASPFGIPQTWSLSNARAKNLGFPFEKLTDWLVPLIKKLAQ